MGGVEGFMCRRGRKTEDRGPRKDQELNTDFTEFHGLHGVLHPGDGMEAV